MICAWNEARAALEGATCMWQDLDGLHCATAPATAPPTSIVWAWWPYPSDKVARLRIDEDIVYLAEAAWPSGSTPTIPWGADDRRVAQYRSAPDTSITVTARFATAVVDGLTFVRPVDAQES